MIFIPSLRVRLTIGAFALGVRNSFDGQEEVMKIMHANDDDDVEVCLCPF